MKKQYPDARLDMTPMIDVVFQLIIFFITAVDMENKALETNVKMAMSPHGPVETKKDPRTVIIDVEQDGTIRVAGAQLTEGQLRSIMLQVRQNTGQTTPVVIRADLNVTHEYVKRVMDVCGGVGLWKFSLAALKEKA